MSTKVAHLMHPYSGMDTLTSPPEEKPITLLDVRFVNGAADSVTLQDSEGHTLDLSDETVIVAHMGDETVTYNRAHIAAYRVFHTVARRLPDMAPKVGSGT